MTDGCRHTYAAEITWTGNRGAGTAGYRAYGRDYDVTAAGKPAIAGSSDAAFRGDPARYNPEDLLVASLSACHMLWYLHLCAEAGVCVTAYRDQATGTMVEAADGGGRFVEVTLRPRVTVTAGSDRDLAMGLHRQAHARCFIANSVNFPVVAAPRIDTAP